MKDVLITSKTAKLAKKKGFDFSNIEIRDSNTLVVADNVKARLDYFDDMEEANLVKLPTQSLLQRWLRDIHNIHVNLNYIELSNYNYQITYFTTSKHELYGNGLQLAYEKALEVGLQEALKLIKL